MFTVDNFWELLDAASGDTVDGLTDVLDSLAKDSKAKGELYFDNVLGGAPPTTEPDWIRLRSFLLDWYAAHQTMSAASSSVSDPRTLTNPDLDELFRSFGYDFSTQLKGPDDNPIDLKINFFLDLVNLYKRKGTPQAIVEVLQYYGVTKVDIFEFFIKLESVSSLVFEGTAIAGTTTNPSKLTFEYDRLTADDPHWLYTEAQILALQQINDINLPSKTPYLGIQPVAAIDGAEIGILIRIVQDQFQYYLDNGVPPTANAEVSEIGEIVSLLELYLSIIYVFNKQFNVGKVGDSFICYDGTSTNVTTIINEFEIITAKPTTRAEILTGLEAFYDAFTRETPRDFLQNRSDAETFLTMINPSLKSSLDSSTLTEQELLFSLMKDLSSWVRINLGYGFVNMGFIMFGLDSFFDDLKPVINFFKPYRARLLLLELLQINNPLFNTIIVEDTFEGVKVEFPIYDWVTGNGNPCCTEVDIDTTDCCTVCLSDSTTNLYYQRETYDCNSYYDIGAVTDILQGDFFPMIYEIRHIHLVCIPPDLDSTSSSTIVFNEVIAQDSTAYVSFGDIIYQELTTGGFADFEGVKGISNGEVYDPADGTTVIALLYENHSSGTFDCPTAFDEVWITVYQESSSSSSVSSSSSSSSYSLSSSSSSNLVTVLACSFLPDDDFTGVDFSAPDTDRWTVWTAADGFCYIRDNELRMWSNSYGGLARCTNNAEFDGDLSIWIEWLHVSSGPSVPIHWYINLKNNSNNYQIRLNNGNDPAQSFDNYLYVQQYDGSWSTTYKDYNPILTAGNLKFVRTGSSLAVWADENDGGGLTLRDTMANFGTGKCTWHIEFPNASNSNFNTWRFDNFTLNQGIMSCSSSSVSSSSSSTA